MLPNLRILLANYENRIIVGFGLIVNLRKQIRQTDMYCIVGLFKMVYAILITQDYGFKPLSGVIMVFIITL